MNDQDEEADDVPTLSEFSDPRLVAIYDTVNPLAEYEAARAVAGLHFIAFSCLFLQKVIAALGASL